jgi:hypothetical protein
MLKKRKMDINSSLGLRDQSREAIYASQIEVGHQQRECKQKILVANQRQRELILQLLKIYPIEQVN